MTSWTDTSKGMPDMIAKIAVEFKGLLAKEKII
jgi:hypothetical protein